jgi:hypothetical protein
LCRHHHEQIRQLVGHATDGNLAFRHRFEQGRLHLGRRTVDLVGQHQIMEQRSGLKMERTVLRTIDLGAGQIGRQQVRGKLNAVKIALDGPAQHVDRPSLGKAGRTFHENVPIREQRDQHPLDQSILSDYLGRHKLEEPLHILLSGR